MREQADTRTRIQEIALRLFVEQGYEATSLREIAEILGVTKAALYYHFKTKDDIVASLAEERLRIVEELIAWAEARPRTDETRRELLHRYADGLYHEHHHQIMRFFERNQTAMKNHPVMEKTRERMLHLIGFLVEPGDSAVVRLRSSMALFALHASGFLLSGDDLSDDERRAAALEVALDLVRR
ncbi:TetR/AcrR family transcriptional regulator [Planomonospora sp. ID91781]|uniref:TetR family transcriptional regulator n=3 Tax=Planomonospora TaxID=1998 RepID=A0A171DNG4_9ACTN|nr:MULTISPECIES: TetR/AcrR family transcriptional regulator [Planomonospora]MBG0822837.1 TetR/AcrR family transcriptional regulator [Planomonospora sp. ID91781]GAT70602.1 tetR family transcriptional regulator [Planomonospora sphaerica]GGK87302.1 TetR family transcriptional regulator [Planomonospora parontospora]GII11439.1 TetR family transcriptional regulator [Planomonospora parontospora subsp. parontospora]